MAKIEIGFYSQDIDSTKYTMYAWLEGATKVEKIEFKTNRDAARMRKVYLGDSNLNTDSIDEEFSVHVWIVDKSNNRSNIETVTIALNAYGGGRNTIDVYFKDGGVIEVDARDTKTTRIIIGTDSPE